MFASMLQIIACVIWSRPASPNSCCGLSSSMPNGPCSTKLIGSHPERASAGSSSVYSQTAKPALSPHSAPARVPKRTIDLAKLRKELQRAVEAEVELVEKLGLPHVEMEGQKYVIKLRHKYRYGSSFNLLHTVKTGEAAFDYTFGQDFFAYLAERREDAAIFDEAMAGESARTADAILSKYDFSHLRTLIDVGGGNATVMTAILRATPDLRGIVVDLPHLEEQAKRTLAAAELADRGRFIGGTFFDPLPERADACLLKLVLHSFNDSDCISILRNCRRSMSTGGKVLVVDQIMPSGNEQPRPDQVALDLTMLVLRRGRERNENEFRRLFHQAGLQLIRTVPLQSGQHILEAASA